MACRILQEGVGNEGSSSVRSFDFCESLVNWKTVLGEAAYGILRLGLAARVKSSKCEAPKSLKR